MLTKDGLKKKKCFLKDDKLIIDGETYSIENLKQIKIKIVLLIFIAIFAVYSVYYIATSYLIFIKFINPKILSSLLKNIIIFLLTLPIIGFLSIVANLLYKIIKYRSCWAVNYYHPLWIEKHDPSWVEDKLNQIEKTLPGPLAKSHISYKFLITLISGLILVAISLFLFKNYKILMPLLLVAGFLLISVAAILNTIEAWNRSKWKN
jgi:hypothetical protein